MYSISIFIYTLIIALSIKWCLHKIQPPNLSKMNHQSLIVSDPDQNQSQPIELQSNGMKKQTKDQTQTLQDIILLNIKEFWLEKMKNANKTNNIKSSEKNENVDIKKVIQVGLEVQQYLGQETQFSYLYAQEIQNDFSRIKAQKQQKIFVRKAKRMLEKFIDKYDQVKVYLLFPLNWVKQRIPSYPHLIQNPICLKQIQQKLRLNIYQSFENFLTDMDKVFNEYLIFNFGNKQVEQMILRLRNNWTAIKYQTLQLKNFAIQPFINPPQILIPEALDIDEEINLLRQRVSVDKNMSEYLDYDPDYLIINNLKNNNSASNSQEKRKKSNQKKKSSQSKTKMQTKKVFESCQSYSKTIGKQRILELKKNISKCIAAQMAQKDLEERKLLKYINQKRISNPNFIGHQNQINLEILGYEEFIELEQIVQKYLNYS